LLITFNRLIGFRTFALKGSEVHNPAFWFKNVSFDSIRLIKADMRYVGWINASALQILD
jgi:hypothetical protein